MVDRASGEERTWDRLEKLRSAQAVPSVREFWRRVVESGHYSGSYASAATYHSNREAPAEYLVAVEKVFGGKLRWLITGEGPMTLHEEEVIGARRKAEDTPTARALGGDPNYELFLRPGVRELLEVTVARLVDSDPDRLGRPTAHMLRETEQLAETLCRDLATLLLLPPKLWGFLELGDDTRTHRYLVGMLNALETLIPEPRQGEPSSEYAPVRELRVLLEERS